MAVQAKMSLAINTSLSKEVATRNFFTPLRMTEMDTDSPSTEASPREETAPGKSGRPPPTVLTTTTNLIQLQKQLKSVVKEDFEFHSTQDGTKVIMRGMADFQTMKSHFDNNNLSYYSFFLKSPKNRKAVIHHLPHNTPAEYTRVG
jgi:hypothetical protein